MVLVFYTNPEAPAQCAVEISRALKEDPRLQVRMGIHSGPVSGVVDVNERANLTGAGINIAKRVMDCGDAGHILLSKHVAEDLEEYEQWRSLLHDLGSCEVKHGMQVAIVNLWSTTWGTVSFHKGFKLSGNTAPECAGPKWQLHCFYSPASQLLSFSFPRNQ
jgi:Adenylate and Guanylate cyclase catalytic domain